MSNLLQQYYQGITQQLRSEVDFINSLFKHQGLKGDGNESALRDLLAKFIPKRYGIGTGVVIDQHGKPSRQCDIVIYDTFLYPSLLSLTSAHLFPVDIVYATIEIKTTLTSVTAKEALENVDSVKSLDFLKTSYEDIYISNGQQAVGMRKPTAPLGCVFGYNTGRKPKAFKKWFFPTESQDTSKFPNLIGCLDTGLIYIPPELQVISASAINSTADVNPECKTFYTNKDGKEVIDEGQILLYYLLKLSELLSDHKLHPSISFLETYMKFFNQEYSVF